LFSTTKELSVNKTVLGLFAFFLMQAVCAKESVFCSPYGNDAVPVISRVKDARAGEISSGYPVSLRIMPTDACDIHTDCKVDGTTPVRTGTTGVELGINQSWVCIGVPGTRPLDVWFGWVPAQRWHRSNNRPQPATRWPGVWQNNHAKLKVRSTDGILDVSGNALWGGGGLNTAHFGDFQATGVPIDGLLSIGNDTTTGACRVALRLVGSFLVAADNRYCGGANVTFDGIYRLRHR